MLAFLRNLLASDATSPAATAPAPAAAAEPREPTPFDALRLRGGCWENSEYACDCCGPMERNRAPLTHVKSFHSVDSRVVELQPTASRTLGRMPSAPPPLARTLP